MPFGAYLELSAATLRNVAALGARAAFTGPMARQDWTTLRRHLDALSADEHATYLAMAGEAARLLDLDLPGDLGGDRPG